MNTSQTIALDFSHQKEIHGPNPYPKYQSSSVMAKLIGECH